MTSIEKLYTVLNEVKQYEALLQRFKIDGWFHVYKPEDEPEPSISLNGMEFDDSAQAQEFHRMMATVMKYNIIKDTIAKHMMDIMKSRLQSARREASKDLKKIEELCGEE